MEAHGQLIQRAVGGDEEALSLLLEEHGECLHAEIERSIAPQYRGLFDADDILQVTYLEAFLRVRAFVPAGPNSFPAWLRRIAENNLRDAIRELEREKRPPPARRASMPVRDESYAALVERLAATTTTASRLCAREELRSGVERALQQLPADYAQALRLYELEGLSGQEVSERMGRSHGAVRMLLARARERLAEVIAADTHFVSRA